ncbi:hypothetical protein D3C71_1752820 [compost metagenome]
MHRYTRTALAYAIIAAIMLLVLSGCYGQMRAMYECGWGNSFWYGKSVFWAWLAGQYG